MPTSERADLSKVLPAVRCTARKRNGEPCKAMAARGATVCRVHGGSAPQVKAAAQRRLQNAADALVQRLLGFALDDGDTPPAVALAAIRDALDRAGMSTKHAVEVEVGPTPAWQQALTGLSAMTRAESRAARGLPDDSLAQEPPQRALTSAQADEPIDAEVIDDGPLSPPPWRDSTEEPPAPGNALMTMEQAAEAQAEIRAQTGVRKIRSQRGAARYRR